VTSSRSISSILVGLLAVSGCIAETSESADSAAVAGATEALTACASIPGWTMKSYAAGERVLVNGTVYECKAGAVSGWCGIGDAYEPGVGGAWRDAWTQVSACGGASCTGVPAWSVGTTSKNVQVGGAKYSCKVGGWCASPSGSYQPDVGAYWTLAWSRVGTCSAVASNAHAMVLVDARLSSLLSSELATYVQKASTARGFAIDLRVLNGLDDWKYADVKSYIIAERSENPALEGVLLVGNIKLPTFYKPRADILDTRVYPTYLEDFDATFEKRLVPGATERPCSDTETNFATCAVGGGIVPEHDFDYIQKGANPEPEIWTAYMPVGVAGTANSYADFADQLRPYLQKVISYYNGEIVSNGRFYGVSGDKGERFDLTVNSFGHTNVDFYGKPGPTGETGDQCLTASGENLCYVRWPIETYASYPAFETDYLTAGWVGEGWQTDSIYLQHMNEAIYDVTQVNVHSNEVWSLVSADQARGITKGALFAAMDGCSVAGFVQPGSPSYANTGVQVSDNVLLAYLYGSSRAIAGGGDPAWRGHYANFPHLFEGMKVYGQYLGKAHLRRMIQNYADAASDSYDLKERANEMLVGDPFMKL
jgi:hypothetical protein